MIYQHLNEASEAVTNKDFAKAEQLYREVLQGDATNEAAFKG